MAAIIGAPADSDYVRIKDAQAAAARTRIAKAARGEMPRAEVTTDERLITQYDRMKAAR